MAKVVSPLMSMSASGTVGKTLVYATGRGGIQYCRLWASPSNPNSAAQQVIRGYFTDAVNAWHGETSTVRTAWNNYANSNGMAENGFNLYVGVYVKFLVDHTRTPPTVTTTPPNMS